MIDINRNNYEQYFLDFLEGKLSPSQENMLMSFFDSNPDLKEEFELYSDAPELTAKTVFPEKEMLRKSATISDDTLSNFDELCIARIEGDLDEKEINEFDNFIKENNKREKEFNLYRLTKITTDTSIEFPHKNRLRKKGNESFVFKNRYSLISAAASVVIAIAVYYFLPKNPIGETLQYEKIASIDDVKNNKEKAEISTNIKEEKVKDIISDKTIKKIKLNGEINEVVTGNPVLKDRELIRQHYQFAKLNPVEIEMEFKSTNRKLAYVNPVGYKIQENKSPENNSNQISFKSFLAETFNKRVLKKENKDKLELFDFAQAGVEGINKLTGSNMSLQRIYDENGIPDKTEFNSRLIAFSTPVKNNQTGL